MRDKEKSAAWWRAYCEANREKIRAQQRAYRAANKEKRRAQHRAWYQTNKEKKLAQQRAYREANAEKMRVKDYAYNAANKEKKAAQQRAYRAANKEKLRTQDRAAYARRKTRMLNGPIDNVNPLRLLVKQRGKCGVCKTDITTGYHLDHIQALANGGTHTHDNLWLLCPTCNLSKNATPLEVFLQRKANG